MGVKLFGLTGPSGSGKTTLLTRLLPVLTAEGLTVSTIKHAHHDVDIDRPGKDSHRHRMAGASEVLVASAKRWALLHEHRDAPEPPLAELAARLAPVDLVLVEGFGREPFDKIAVHRAALGLPPRLDPAASVVAVASDVALPSLALPWFALDDIAGIATFVIARCGLGRDRR